jgi:hypothetical protein
LQISLFNRRLKKRRKRIRGEEIFYGLNLNLRREKKREIGSRKD